jgi:hypothetical protein
MKRALVYVLLAGCSSDPPDPPATPQWKTVLEPQLDRALLSVWGTGSDVFAVGGSLGNGLPSLALRYDGKTWRELNPGGTETFWWVNGTSSTDVWMVGEKGRIAHWNGSAFSAHTSGTTATLWGVWAFAANDAWAVGGTPGGGTAQPNDVVLHFDGTSWKPEALPDAPLGRSLFKVWGTSSNDLYVVGEAGTIWHRKSASWILESKTPLATGTLFTVYGCSANEVYAVGGSDVLRSDGTTWSRVTIDLSSQVNGVSCAGSGNVAVVGFGGLKQRLVSGKWIDEFALEPFADLHAVWGDPRTGDLWAVGGEWLSLPSPSKPRRGVVARFGRGDVGTTIAK